MLNIIEKHKPIIKKNKIGEKIKLTADDKTVIAVNNTTTKNSFAVNNFLSGFIKASKNGKIVITILSIGTDVSVFTVQNRSTIVSKTLTIPANSQLAVFIDDEYC